MDRDVAEMTRQGYSIAGQSGAFAANQWTTNVLNRPKVTVTFVREAPKSAPDLDAAISLLVRHGYTVTAPS
jgi:phage tail sheath gpL-like